MFVMALILLPGQGVLTKTTCRGGGVLGSV